MIKKIFSKLKLIFIPCKANKYRPFFLASKFLFYYVIFLLFLKFIFVPFLFYFPETAFFADLTRISLINSTNIDRKNFGFSELKENAILNQAAYLKAKDMIDNGYFDHYSPQGVSPWYWFEQSGYNYALAGENLAIGFLESDQVHQAWMNSPSHKKNILNPNYQEIGISVVKGNFNGKETTFVVQLLGKQKEPVYGQGNLLTEEQASEITALETDLENRRIAGKEAIVESPVFFLFHFMISDYYNWIQIIIYVSLIFIIIFMLIIVYCDIFIYRRFKVDYRDVVFKTVGFSFLWFILVYIDKLMIAQLIAQDFRIN